MTEEKNGFSKSERNDKNRMLKVIEDDGYNLKFASESLKDDEDIVKASIKQEGIFIEFASERLRDNIEIALLAVEQNGLALGFLSERMQNNFDVVFKAVSQTGRALVFAGKTMKDNEEIVLSALRNYPASLKFASKRIRDIKKYVLMALEGEKDYDFVGLDTKWFKDPIFLFEGVKITNKLLKKFDREFLSREMVLAFVKRDGLNLEYLPEYCDDFEIVKEAVSQNGMALKFASNKLKDNLQIALIAMSKDIEASRYIGENVRKYLRSIPDRFPG